LVLGSSLCSSLQVGLTPRARAVRAAFGEIGSGRVVTVERESRREIEVSIRVGAGRQIEVELDRSFAAVEVEPEDPRDE
jgi:hypothetical protein